MFFLLLWSFPFCVPCVSVCLCVSACVCVNMKDVWEIPAECQVKSNIGSDLLHCVTSASSVFFFLQNSVLSYSILEVYPTAIELTGLSTVRKEIHVFDEHCNKMWERKHFFFFLLFLCFLFQLGKMRRMILPSRLDPSAGR